MIFNETFDALLNSFWIADSGKLKRAIDNYQRKRLARVFRALQVKPFYLQALATVEADQVFPVSVSGFTDPIEKEILITQVTAEAAGSCLEVRVSASIDSRPQMSIEFMRDAHIVGSAAWGQWWPLKYPFPFVLHPYERIRVEWRPILGYSPPTSFPAICGFHGVTVDPGALACVAPERIEAIKQTIYDNPYQQPRYLHALTDTDNFITMPTAVAGQTRAIANTRESEEHLLITGFNFILNGDDQGNSDVIDLSLKVYSSIGDVFSKLELNFNAYNCSINGPQLFGPQADQRHYYVEFQHPYYLPKGASMAISMVMDTAIIAASFPRNEILFRGVTI